MGKRIRYASVRDGHVETLEAHAKGTTDAIFERAKELRPSKEGLRRLIAEKLEDALRAAFEAGDREGRTRTEAELEETVKRLVARAVDGIKLEGGRCPHCVNGCHECNGTGRRPRR